jgi:hypothetical protein
MNLQTGDICVFTNSDFKVIWNGGSTFNVFDNLDNEVDCFSVNGITNSSDAIWEAREWIDNLYKEMGGHNV